MQKNRKFDQNYFENNLKQQINSQVSTRNPFEAHTLPFELTVRQNYETSTSALESSRNSDELDLEKFLANTIIGLKKPAANNFRLNLSHLNPSNHSGKDYLNGNRLSTLILDESNSSEGPPSDN